MADNIVTNGEIIDPHTAESQFSLEYSHDTPFIDTTLYFYGIQTLFIQTFNISNTPGS